MVEALEAINRVKPQRAYFTHMSHLMDYDALTPKLPPNVALGYDGLSFEF
jgi:phosphoribosyl 1,2-cyclic phosphate phosphodiesterase